MRRAFLGLVLISIAAATGFGVFWFFVRGGNGDANADSALSGLSRQSVDATYYARYTGAGEGDPNSIGSITFYHKPRVGFRIDLAAPLDPEGDAKQTGDVLKSGDIFIVNPAVYGSYISCRTARHSCRTSDALEGLAIRSLLLLFNYGQPIFDQPHTVTRGNDISAAGETARCFIIAQRIGTKNEQATAERSGFVPGAGLPKTFCYTNDGIPLGGLVSDAPPNTDWIKAVEIEREVDAAVFEPPFPMVASVYDDTPTAEPSAPTPLR